MLTGNFFLQFIPYMVNNPIFYAAIMTLWLVEFPNFKSLRTVIVMSVVVPATACSPDIM